jgi:cyanophycinase-like exopeptidase
MEIETSGRDRFAGRVSLRGQTEVALRVCFNTEVAEDTEKRLREGVAVVGGVAAGGVVFELAFDVV